MASPISYSPGFSPVTPWNRQSNWQNLQTDPGPIWRNERLMAQTRGDQWEGEQAQRIGQYGQGESGYSNLVGDLYNPIWGGGGGFTPDQFQNILGQERMDETLGGLDQNFLSPEERQGAMGNPFGAFGLAGDYERGLNSMSEATGNRQEGFLPYLQGGQDAWLGRLEGAYGDAIDRGALRQSGGYRDALSGALGTAMQGVEDPGLDLTQEYLDQARISDEEVGQMASLGARTAAAPYQAGLSTLYRNAREGGMTNPLALGGAALQYNMAQGAAASDAANRARLDARSAQRQAAQNIQDTQLGAAGQRSGLRMGYGQLAGGLAGQAEGMRLGAEQDLSDRLMGAGENLAQMGVGNTRYLSDFATGLLGETGDRNLRTAQGNAQSRLGLFDSGEQNAAGRSQWLGANRQGVNQGNIQTRLGAGQDLSQRYTTGYSPWLAAQQEGRQAAQGQQGYFGGRTQDTNSLRLAGNQLQQQGTQGAVQGYNQWRQIDKQPGKVAQGFQIASNFINPVARAGQTMGVWGN